MNLKASKSKENKMTTINNYPNDEAQIRAIIERRVKAVSEKDIDALLSNQARDILSFDVINPLQHNGIEAIRERAEKWFASYQS